MSFRPAGFRPAVVRYAVVLAVALSSGAIFAQEAKNPAPATTTAKPAAAATAPAAAETAKPAEATAATKPGDATAGQGKAAACGACHGMDGNSTDPQYPRLAGQSEAYIVRQAQLAR